MTPLAWIDWLPLDTWTVLVAAACALSCALLGTFLVLRRMSMMGDAISHAVLPGLAVAFLLTGSRDSVVMLIGAGVVGLLTALLTQWVHSAGRVEQGAAMGVVFTILFAGGLILIRQAADHVDLDPDCVLYGAIELVALDTVPLFGLDVPRALLTTGGVFLLDLLCVLLLYKELKLAAFDPALATTLGFNANLLHYLLMTLVALTTVVAFESVGSILVVAMLIVTPAAAHLLTDRLGRMLVLSLILAAASAGLGHLAALTAPGLFGFTGLSTSTAGMMGVVAGVLFAVAMLFSPRHGLVSKLLHRVGLAVRIVREDVLGLLYRLDELGPAAALPRNAAGLGRGIGVGPLLTGLALRSLRRRGEVEPAAGMYRLTPAGRTAAQGLVRTHRLWETYLGQFLGLPPDHLHETAERLEHVTGAALQTELAESLGYPAEDPQGKRIPGSQ